MTSVPLVLAAGPRAIGQGWKVLVLLTPNSSLSWVLDALSHLAVVEVLVVVGDLGAVQPVDGDSFVGTGVRGRGCCRGRRSSSVQPTTLKLLL